MDCSSTESKSSGRSALGMIAFNVKGRGEKRGRASDMLPLRRLAGGLEANGIQRRVPVVLQRDEEVAGAEGIKTKMKRGTIEMTLSRPATRLVMETLTVKKSIA